MKPDSELTDAELAAKLRANERIERELRSSGVVYNQAKKRIRQLKVEIKVRQDK